MTMVMYVSMAAIVPAAVFRIVIVTRHGRGDVLAPDPCPFDANDATQLTDADQRITYTIFLIAGNNKQ